jgi:hypothetical protein
MMKQIFEIYIMPTAREKCAIFLFEDFLHTKTMSNTNTVTTLERLANLLRIRSIESTQAANSGLIGLVIYMYFLFICIIDIQRVAHPWLK